jgi:hypothetical protein
MTNNPIPFSIYWNTKLHHGDGIMNLTATSHEEAEQRVKDRLLNGPNEQPQSHPSQAYPPDATIWFTSISPVEPYGCVVCSALLEQVPRDRFNGDKYRCTNPDCGRSLWFEKLGPIE